MIAAYYLVLLITGGGPSPSSITSIPMRTEQACIAAQHQAVQELAGGYATSVRAVCLKADD